MRKIAITFGCLIALVVAAPAWAEVREVGVPADAPFPEAGCPTNCLAIGRVTGYQAQIGKSKNPFTINQAGKIVAFSIRLGAPDASQSDFFTRTFGGGPQVRLTVLRPLRRSRGFTLAAQSELFDLSPYLGSTPTFALSAPLSVPAGAFVALTVPTWAPAFAAAGLGADQAWRSPRTNCNDNTQSATQQTFGTARRYRCTYRKARLLYSVSFVPNPVPTKSLKARTQHGTAGNGRGSKPGSRRGKTRRRATRRPATRRR